MLFIILGEFSTIILKNYRNYIFAAVDVPDGMNCNQIYSVHLEIMGESTQIVHDAVVCIALHNLLDSFVTQSISSKLPRRSMSGYSCSWNKSRPFRTFFSPSINFLSVGWSIWSSAWMRRWAASAWLLVCSATVVLTLEAPHFSTSVSRFFVENI